MIKWSKSIKQKIVNKKCIKCGTKLTTNNSKSYWIDLNYYICNDCDRKLTKIYNKKYTRTRLVNTIRNGKSVYILGHKRLFPKDHKCEVCHNYQKVLAYHHWDDTNLLKGMWICPFGCHGLAEKLDKFTIQIAYTYIQFKDKINQEAYK